MNHPNEQQLFEYREGDAARREEIAAHLRECAECRKEMERLDAVLAALDALPMPDPGAHYGEQVWKKIAPKLKERKRVWRGRIFASGLFTEWFAPRRLATVGVMAALVVAAFVLGRHTGDRVRETPVADAAKVRERVLVVAVGEHLGRSEMMLIELSNAEPKGDKGKEVNIAAEQRRAEDLLAENRLFRQAATREGDASLSNVLDELERVLVDVANSPEEISAAQLETIQKRIEAHGVLFKVRVVGKELRDKGMGTKPAPGKDQSGKKEGKA